LGSANCRCFAVCRRYMYLSGFDPGQIDLGLED